MPWGGAPQERIIDKKSSTDETIESMKKQSSVDITIESMEKRKGIYLKEGVTCVRSTTGKAVPVSPIAAIEVRVSQGRCFVTASFGRNESFERLETLFVGTESECLQFLRELAYYTESFVISERLDHMEKVYSAVNVLTADGFRIEKCENGWCVYCDTKIAVFGINKSRLMGLAKTRAEAESIVDRLNTYMFNGCAYEW